MDILKSALITLFKEQNPYKVLESHYSSSLMEEGSTAENIDKETFIKLYMELEKQYSRDEVENLYNIVLSKMDSKMLGLSSKGNVFSLIVNYCDSILEDNGDNVKCKYKSLLKWRMVTLKLDQDMFVCAYLAYKDYLIGRKRSYYDWETIIKSNNKRINNMLSKGIAENHFHLKGSSPTYKLSWVALMNDISCRNTDDIKIDSNRGRLSKDLMDDINLKDCIIIAAVIRIILFLKVSEEKGSKCNDIIEEFENILREGYDDSNNSELLILNTNKIQNTINNLKYIFGSTVRYKENETYVDYALTKEINNRDFATSLFAGERAFMYKCFKKIYEGDKEFLKYGDLFYAYLIIKNKVRAEMVQMNDAVGFSNFASYQDRKTKYLKKGTVLYDYVEPGAVITSIKSQNIKSIELRVIPEETAEENVKMIIKRDKEILNKIYNDRNNVWMKQKKFSDKIYDNITSSEMEFYLSQGDKEELHSLKSKFFYVYHFPKGKDELEDGKPNDYLFMTRCRHYKARKKMKKYAYGIYKMREDNQEYAQRVLGIDTCAYEIKARPEVFGQAFRFLKGHIPTNNTLREYKDEINLPRLRATYHVGEDFLDCVDGLRAIDEAILFCGLTHGDRLGHAIVLGININDWYEKKNHKVHLSKHDILDNVAWLIYKLKMFSIPNSSEDIGRLTALYNKYYTEIYISSGKKDSSWEITEKNVIPVDTYIEAWKLRGDDPEIYYDKKPKQPGVSYWERCSKINFDERPNNVITELYRRYHYDPHVKHTGYEKEVFKVDPYIVRCCEKVQKAMQDYVRASGIAIECNPSSNVLISNFERYDKHPILNMYNLGLTIDEDEAGHYPQLFVSINTDDQGIFDTLLENEFALMAIALEKAKDENGKPIYSQAMIYDWLDRIRKMGLEQSFNELDI